MIPKKNLSLRSICMVNFHSGPYLQPHHVDGFLDHRAISFRNDVNLFWCNRLTTFFFEGYFSGHEFKCSLHAFWDWEKSWLCVILVHASVKAILFERRLLVSITPLLPKDHGRVLSLRRKNRVVEELLILLITCLFWIAMEVLLCRKIIFLVMLFDIWSQLCVSQERRS